MSSPVGSQTADGALGDAARLVGRIVQHLNLEQLARVVDARDRLDQPVRHVHLVVERQLDGDRRAAATSGGPAFGSWSRYLM